MNKEYTILKIYNGRKSTFKYKDLLKREGFKFVKKPFGRSYWEKKVNDSGNTLEIKKEYKKKGLKVEIIESRYIRNSKYREEFFKANKPLFKNKYFCAYCGKLFNKEDITVDHIFPVNKVSKNKFLQWILNILNIENVNDTKNLAACCKHCNSSKGNKTGFWIIRGFVGRYVAFYLRILLILLIILTILFGIFKFINLLEYILQGNCIF